MYPVKPFDGIVEVLKKLAQRGVKMAIVTSNTSVNVKQALGDDVIQLFDFVIGVDNGAYDKISSVKAALQRLGTPAEGTVYIGDTIKDFHAAAANNLAFIGVNYGFEDLTPHQASFLALEMSVSSLSKLLLSSPQQK